MTTTKPECQLPNKPCLSHPRGGGGGGGLNEVLWVRLSTKSNGRNAQPQLDGRCGFCGLSGLFPKGSWHCPTVAPVAVFAFVSVPLSVDLVFLRF